MDEKGRKEEPTGEVSENGAAAAAFSQADDSMSHSDAAQLEMLTGMGFEEAKVRKALRKFPSADDPECERKMEWILEGGDDAEEEELLSAFMGQDDDDQSPFPTDQSETSTLQTNPNSGPSAPQSDASLPNSDSPVDVASAEPKKKVREVPQALQQLFGILEQGNVAYASTLPLTQSFGWKASHTSVQHDVHELSRVLMDVVERSLRGTPKSTLVRSLFHGTQCHQIKCLRCGLVKERSEEFGDLTLAIPRGAEFETQQATAEAAPKHGKNTRASARAQNTTINTGSTSLDACLAHYFGMELLSGSNQYECDACAMRTDAEIGMRMKHLPRVLCLSLARMEYNYASGNRVKNTGTVSFPPSIDIAPYLSDKSNQGASEIELEGEPSSIYDLYAVIVHKGQTATSGHYHAYVKDLFNLSQGKAGDFNADDDDDEESSKADDTANSNGKNKNGNKNANKKKKTSNVEGGAAWAHSEAISDAHRAAGISPDLPLPADAVVSESSVWYNFDDTRVTRVSSRTLPKVFSSSECAYMFFYRQRETVPTAELLDAIVPSHPVQLDSYLDAFNKDLADAREAYEKEINEICLELTTPSHLCTIIPAPAEPQVVNKNMAFGPPTFRWIEDEVKNGRLRVDEASAPQLNPVSLTFDQRKTMSELMEDLTKILNESGDRSLGTQSSSSLLMSLARTHHDKVLLERSFSIQRSAETGLWSVLREEKEVMALIDLAHLSAVSEAVSLEKSTVKSLTFSKRQRVIFWDGKHFPVGAVLASSSEPNSGGTLVFGPQSALPFLLQAPYSTARVRLYHQEKLSLPLSAATVSSDEAQSVTYASETLRHLFNDEEHDLETFVSWNDVCDGGISIEAINVPNPYGTASFVTTLAVQVPPSISLARILEICKRSLLVKRLLNDAVDVVSASKILQPNLETDDPSVATIVGDDSLVKDLTSLEKRVDSIKLERWNEHMQEDGLDLKAADVTNEGSVPKTILIDDTCGVILALDINPQTPLLDASFKLEVASVIANASSEALEDEGEYEEDDPSTQVDGENKTEKPKKKKRTVDFYVILNLKMPKSAFYIRNETDAKTEAEENSLSTRLALNAPLPDDEKSTATFGAEGSQYNPRYVIRAVPEDETLRELVKRVYNVSGLAQPPRLPLHSRLYSTDAFEQRDRIFDNFSVTIKQAQISSYSTLWLEEGDEPRPGLLQLSSKLFRLAPNKLAVNIAENPLVRPVPTLRANLLFLPLPLSSFFSPPAPVAPVAATENDGLPPPPPPPPLPPTATAFLLEATQASTLSELKDNLSELIESHVRELWRAECKKKLDSGVSKHELLEAPTLAFFYEYFPFDFFLATNAEDKRRSMSLWIDDQIMVDDGNSSKSLPLRSWRLNSWQRCNIAVVLQQTLPKHPISCIELKTTAEPAILSFVNPSASLSMTAAPVLAPDDPRKMTSLFTFIRGRCSEVPKINAPEASEISKSDELSQPRATGSFLVDSGQYGDLSMLWVTVPSATPAKTVPSGGKGKAKNKATATATASAPAPHTQTARHAHLASNALVDLDALVLAFARGLVSLDSDESTSSAPSVIPAIPPEWLLLARVGIMPHHHGMPLPKWQLIWRPMAFVQEEEALEAAKPAESSTASGVATAESADASAPAAEKPKAIPTDEYGLGPDESAFANRNCVLMKHLQDKKVPGCQASPTGFVLPALKKVKLQHGDTIVYADARTWAKGGLHEDVFWDEQRRRGFGNGEDAFLSDLEKALIESSNMASKSRHREEALVIDVDF